MARAGLFTAVLLLAAGAPAVAAELVLTDFTDDPANPAPDSFRDLVARAQPGDTIRFSGPGLVALAGEVRIATEALRIVGPGGFRPATPVPEKRPKPAPPVGLRVVASGVVFEDVEIRDVPLAFGGEKKKTRLALAAVEASRVTGKGALGFTRCDEVRVLGCAFTVDHGPESIETTAQAVFALQAGTLRVLDCTGEVRGARFLNAIEAGDALLQRCEVAGSVNLFPGMSQKKSFPFAGDEPGTVLVEDVKLGAGSLVVAGTPRSFQPGPITVRRVECATLRVWGGRATVEDVVATEGVPSTAEPGVPRDRLYRVAMNVSNQNHAGDMVVRNCRTVAGKTGLEVRTDRGVENCTVEAVTVQGAADFGILLVAGARSTVLKGCDVSGGDGHAGWMGILATGDKKAPVLVEGNTVHDGPGIGIRVVQDEPGLTLRGNTIRRCVGFGIYVQGTAEAVIEGGTVEETRSGRVEADEDGRYDAVDGTGAGVGVGQRAKARVSGVTLRGNAGAGVAVDEKSAVEIAQLASSANAGPGIDLAPFGVTPNAQPRTTNGNVPYPDDLELDGDGRITGSAPAGATVEVYGVETGERLGNASYGEGAVFLGSTTAGADGRFVWPAEGAAPCPPSRKYTLTATVRVKKALVTSEFSEDLKCAGPSLVLCSRSSKGSPSVPGDEDSTTVAQLGVQAVTPSGQAAFAANRWVVFASASGNLTTDPHVPGHTHVYLHDAVEERTVRISRSYDGGPFESDLDLVGNRVADTATISDDGRFVAFVARSRRVVPDDFDTYPTVVLWDAQTQSVTPVTDPKMFDPALPSGARAKGGGDYASISGDGSTVAFLSIGMDWDLTETYADQDVFVWTRGSDAVELVSTPTGKVEVANPYSQLPTAPRLSHDGRFVVFAALQNIVPGASGSGMKVYLRDRASQTTEVVSRDQAGNVKRGTAPVISDDGRYVAFSSPDALVAEDTNFIEDVYLVDRQDPGSPVVTRIGLRPDGSQFPTAAGKVWTPSMSGDARFIAFVVQGGSYLPPPPQIGATVPDLYLLDRQTGAVAAIEGPTGEPFGKAFAPTLSRDGTALVFLSDARNLVPTVTTNDTEHVYLKFLDDDEE